MGGLQDYTVLVDKIPGDATDPDELRAFFSKYGEVADVAIGLNNGHLIELFQAGRPLDPSCLPSPPQ